MSQKYSRLRWLLCVKGLVICLYLGWSGSILQFRQNIIKVGSKPWLLTCSSNTYTFEPGSALKRELIFCSLYLSLLYLWNRIWSRYLECKWNPSKSGCGGMLFLQVKLFEKVKPPYVNHPECKNRHSKSKHIDADSNNQFRLEGFANKNTQLTLPWWQLIEYLGRSDARSYSLKLNCKTKTFLTEPGLSRLEKRNYIFC